MKYPQYFLSQKYFKCKGSTLTEYQKYINLYNDIASQYSMHIKNKLYVNNSCFKALLKFLFSYYCPLHLQTNLVKLCSLD